MIDILRPQTSSRGSSSKNNAYIREHPYVAPQRYGVGQVASPAAPQEDNPHNGGFLATELPPRPLDVEGCCNNGGQLAVTSIQSPGDVHEIQELSNSAEVGALCVAVVRQSLKRASREISSTTRGGAAVAVPNKQLFGAQTGVSSVEAFLVLLRRYAQAFAPRGNKGEQEYPDACLVLYCKLAGGVIMAAPLEGPTFRLRQQRLPVVEDEEAPAREATETQQLTSWTLPAEGFEALLHLEKSVAPGLPALARDMANDKIMAATIGRGLTPLAEELSGQLYDGDENETQRVVVPRVAGIIFASLGRAAASTTAPTRGGTSVGGGGASLRVRAVLARLEQDGGAVARRFVLEDFDVFGDGGAGEGSRRKGRRSKGRTKRVPLPTTYASLLEEANSPCPSPGPSIATRILKRWRPGHKYRAGQNQVVPGVGEVTVLEKDHQKKALVGAGQSARSEKEATASGEIIKNGASADTAMFAGKVEHSSSSSSSSSQSKILGCGLLSVGDVMSASSSQVVFWASTQDVIRATLAAACRPRGNSRSTPGTQQSTTEPAGASCADARRAACALLARAFGDVPAGEEETGQETTWIGGKESSAALDRWYAELCSVTAPSFGGRGGVEIGDGSSLLLQEEGPRLLLAEMLEIPALQAAFARRGLARHLADALRVGSPKMKHREVRSAWRHAYARRVPDGEEPSRGTSKILDSDPDISCACAGKPRANVGPRQHCCGADEKATLPWWLLFSQGRREGGGVGHGHEHEHSSFSDTLKSLGGSADGVGAEADGRSCQTALDEIFAPERGKEERGAETSREDDDDDPNDGNSLGSAKAGGVPVFATAKQREDREWEVVVDGGTVGGGVRSTTKAGRVAPPMLRLDALESILDTEEGASGRACSSHAVASLSAASTRAASEHLPSFLSARGATSRGSARHGSGRSTRTGRTTQRDSTASTGCPTTVRSTSPSAALVDLEVAAAPHPPLSPPPSSRYNSDGEPVPCCEDREGGAVATMMGPWPEPDDEASVGGATAPPQSAAKARGENTECIVADAGGGLRQHPGGGRTVEAALSALPARQGDSGGGGGGGGSGREGMPRLQLGGLPTKEARRVAKTMGSGGGGSITGGSSPPASITTGQGYLNESAALRQPSEAGENPASWASPETGHESVARLHPGQTVGRASLQSTDGSSAGYVRRSGKGASPSGDVSGALGRRLDDAQPGDEELRCTERITPTTLLLNLARASAPGPGSCSSPPQHSQPGSLSSAFGAEITAATLLVSLLPSTPVEHRPQESLLVALDVLSFVGALSWIDEAEGCAAATSTTVRHGGKRVKDKDPISSHPSDAPEYHLRAPGPAGVCPPGLANLDLALLANTAVGHLDLRLSALESLFEAVWHDDDGDEEMSPDKQKRRVHCACRLVLECTWLTRLLLRSVATAGTLNETLWSPLSAEATADAVRFCARALGMLQCCMRYTLSRCYFGVASSSRAAVDDEGTPEESPEVLLEHGRCCAAEMLLLTSPIAADLAALLAALVRQPMAWGEDPAWAARTLGSAAFLCDGRDAAVIPALVGLLGHLVAEAPRKEGDHRQRVTSEGNQLQRSPRAHRSLPEASEALERGLTGGRAVLDHLLVAVLDSIAAVLRRAKILIETSKDASQGVRGSAAGATAESARADRTQEETREAVFRVARGTALLFQPGGPVLTILEAQSPPTPLHLDGPLLCGDASPDTGLGSTLHIPCMAAALRLSTVFLSLRGTAGIRDEMAELSRPEDFVGPLFLGFCARWGGFVEGRSPDDAVPAFPPPPTEPGHRVGCEGRHEHEPPRQADGDTPIRPKSERERRSMVASSFCRLNLEALVELTAATRHPAVLRRLDDCRVAPFLLGRVLTVGGGGGSAAEGRRQDPLGSGKSAAQGSEEDQLSLANGPDMTALVPHRIQQGKASHGGGGRDDTPEQAKPPGSAAASAGRVSHAAAPFSVGDRVDGRVSVKGGRPRWFPGRVERVSGEDGTVHVCYDDGDEEPNKDPGEVRPSRRRLTERARRRLSSGVGQHSGGKQTPASAAPPPASAATVARQGGKQRPGTDDVTLKPGLSPAADGAASSVDGPRPRPSETAGEAHSSCRDGITDKCEAAEVTTPRGGAEGAGQPPATVEVSAATAVSEGADRDPEPALSSAGGGGNSAENDSEDDDTYFVIPSVLVGAAAAAAATRSTNTDAWSLPAVDPSSSSSSCPVSVVPRIDLQSPVFRTRVFSSQLGPGSSLSTPTTGGGGVLVLDMLRGGGGSRSEASPCTPPFPSHRSSQAPRPPSFISRLRRGSGAKTRSASVLSDSDPSPTANPAGGLERQTTRERETSSSEEEEEKETEEEDGLGSSTSEAVPRCPIQQVSRGADETETGQGHAVAATTTPGVLAGAEGTLSGEKLDHLGDDDSRAAAAIARRQSDDLRVILGLAVTLLLSMAATSSNAALLGLGSHSSPSVPLVEGPGEKQENAHVERVMTVLQEFFEDDRNADIVPSLRVRWRSRVVSKVESAPAVLAKLVCAALFDSQSYPLDGDHISAGRFGGIVVSECPLRFGGARRHRSSVQARGGTSPMGRRGDGESSATLPPLASSSPRGSQAAADDDIDEVALKIVERDELDSAIGAKVFTEVLALRTLADVPGVCGLYDFGVTPASYILVIERCVGSLKEWRLARSAGDESGAGEDGEIASLGGPRSDEEAALYLLVFRQIVSTVAAMAERGVIHLDLKCENILVRRSSNAGTAPLTGPLMPPAVQDGGSCAEHDVVPSVCVADFGESVIGRQSTIGRRRRRRRWRRQRTAGTDASDSSRENTASDPTTDGDFIFDVGASRGTERIQSPEMVLLSGGGGRRGGRLAHLGPGSAGGAREETNEAAGRITPASDVWSLGCLLYELLSTQLLFGDLHWSEFFVTLTAGGAVVGPTGENGMVAPTPTPPPPLPPPRSLRPFAALGCAEALRKLLVAMLVRDPAKRPSASQAVRHVDEALAAVTSSISKRRAPDSAGSKLSMTTPVGERPPTSARTGDEPTSASSHTQGADAYGNVARRRAKSGGNDERTVGTETLSPGAASSRRAEHDRPSNEGKSKLAVTTTLASTAVSVSLRSCVAVAAHRALDAERSALRGCDGCLHRLGAGAFILTGPTGGSGSSSKDNTSAVRSKRKGDQTRTTSKNPDQVLSAGPQVGPETQVWCSAADCCFDLSFGGGEDPGTEEEAGASGGTALGSVLPSLGITHVVCVTSRRAAAATADGRRCSSAATKQKNVSREPQPPVSKLPEGPRFLRVSVLPERDNAEEQEEGHRRPNARLSGPQSMAAVVRDVVEFAAGPRVLFVGGDDDGYDGSRGCDMAGALALVWAMARTGKGSYETMLEFRQRCAGFFVDAAVLRSVLG